MAGVASAKRSVAVHERASLGRRAKKLKTDSDVSKGVLESNPGRTLSLLADALAEAEARVNDGAPLAEEANGFFEDLRWTSMIGFDSMALRATCIDLGARLSAHLSRIRNANLDELEQDLDRYVEGGRPTVSSAEQKSNALRKFNFYREFEGVPPELVRCGTLRRPSC